MIILLLNGIRKYIYFYLRIDNVVNYLFIIDIFANMITAYYDLDNVLVTNNKFILINYLKTWFLLDLCSVYFILYQYRIPFDEIFTPTNADTTNTDTLTTDTNSATSKTSYTQLLRLTRLPRLYRLLKVFKLFRIVRF